LESSAGKSLASHAPGRWTLGSAAWAVGALALALAIATFAIAAQSARRVASPVQISVRAHPLAGFDNRDPSHRQFGFLEFRGGMVLTSDFKEFGGISAIRVQPDGANFIALSDQGWWFRGRIVYEGGRPAGIANAEMAPILGPDGNPLAQRRWY